MLRVDGRESLHDAWTIFMFYIHVHVHINCVSEMYSIKYILTDKMDLYMYSDFYCSYSKLSWYNLSTDNDSIRLKFSR